MICCLSGFQEEAYKLVMKHLEPTILISGPDRNEGPSHQQGLVQLMCLDVEERERGQL